MNIINHNSIHSQINRCYLDYDPQWPTDMQNRVPAFKYYLERTAGLKLDFFPDVRDGKLGYKIERAEVVDNKKYLMWLIKWS